MFSVILNIITLLIVALVVVTVFAMYKRVPEDPRASPTDVFNELINGDRLNEILREPVPKLMSGTIGVFEMNDPDVVYAYDFSA
jgi:uncharacterized membrane protein